MRNNFERVIDNFGAILTFVMVSLVTSFGIVLSFGALLDLARESDAIPFGLEWMWPAMFDLAAVAAMVDILWHALHGERDRYAWMLVIAFTGLSVVFNAIHAGLDGILSFHHVSPLVLKIVIGVVPPIVAALSLHLLSKFLERIFGRVTVMKDISDLRGEKERLSNQVDDLTERASQMSDRLAGIREEFVDFSGDATRPEDRMAAIRKMDSEGMTRNEMAEKLGVSVSTIYRDINRMNGSFHQP